LLHLLGGNLPNSSPPCLAVYFIRPLSSDSPRRHKPGQIKGFRFESYWLNLPGFLDIVKATKAVALHEAELQVEVEWQNASRQTEKLKAEQLSKAVVDYEMKVQQANWELYNRQKAAEALLFEQEREAEARRGVLRAAAGGRRGALRQAEGGPGLSAMGQAQSAYLSAMLGGSYGALRDYLMINSGVYQEMARINAVLGM
jgi:hypothetical protein